MTADLQTQLRDYWSTVYEAMPDLEPEELRQRPLPATAPPPPPVWRWRPVLVAGLAAIVVLLLVGGAALLFAGPDSEPAEEFDYRLSEIPPFRAEVRYTLDPETYGDAADGVMVAVAYGGDGLYRLDLLNDIPALRGELHGRAGSFRVLNGPERGEFSAGDDLFVLWDVIPGGNDVFGELESFAWEPWDGLCGFGEREVLGSGRVAGRGVTQLRCSYGDDSYELSVDSETGLVLRASGGEMPELLIGDTCLCAVGFEVVTVEYEPEFAADHFEVAPPPGARTGREAWTPAPSQGPEPGSPAPPLQGTTLDGAAFDLADLRGSRAALYFWASWCSPDLINPAFDDLAAISLTHPDLAIVTILVDDRPEDARAILAERGIDFPTIDSPEFAEVSEGPSPGGELWGVHGVPLLVLVEEDGSVVHSEPGYDGIGPGAYRKLLHDLGW